MLMLAQVRRCLWIGSVLERMRMCIARVRVMMLRMGVRKGAVGIMKSMISDCDNDEDH
jgi:hypothetical protein